MVISTNLGYLGSYFLKKNIHCSEEYLVEFSSFFTYYKNLYAITIGVGVGVIKAPMSPKRILNVDFSYLPKYRESFYRHF